MDWKSLVEKTKSFTEKSKPLLEKAKVYGSSTIAFVGRQIEQTPIFIKTEEEYNIHASEKRSICIAYDNTSEISETIRIMMPVWGTQAWTDTATLKYIEISSLHDMANNLRIQGPLEMRVSYIGKEQFIFNDIEEIKKWWKDRCYIKDDATKKIQDSQESTEAPIKSNDPLAGVMPTKK